MFIYIYIFWIMIWTFGLKSHAVLCISNDSRQFRRCLNLSFQNHYYSVVCYSLIDWSLLVLATLSHNGAVPQKQLRRLAQAAVGGRPPPLEIRRRSRQEPRPPLSHGRRSRQARRGREESQETPGLRFSLFSLLLLLQRS